jgi:hypothetical protein
VPPCCEPHINGTTGDPGGGAHANIGAGVDIYQDGSIDPINLRRLQALARGQVGDDLSGGLEVLTKPGDVDTNLVRWKNFYVEDLTSENTTSSSFVTATTWSVDGINGDEDFIFIYSCLCCAGDPFFDGEMEVRLMVEGLQYDEWRTQDNAAALPSVPQTRVIRVNLESDSDPMNILLQYRRVDGLDAVWIENKTCWGILYEDP